MKGYLAQFTAQLPLVIGLLLVRLQPLVVYAVAARSLPLSLRAFIFSSYGMLLASEFARSGALGTTLAVWIATVYFGAASLAVYWLAGIYRRRLISQSALFGISTLLFLLLPSLGTPSEFVAIVVILGWDMVLSAFSYCVDNAQRKMLPTLSECLFFMLINPTLIYDERGTRVSPAGVQWSGLRRTGLGVLGLILRCAIVPFVGEMELLRKTQN